MKNSDYNSLLIEFMYQNNRLEGTGFDHKGIRELVNDRIISGSHCIYDIHMIANMRNVFDYMVDTLEKEIDGDMLLSMHNILMDKTWEDVHGFKGKWKRIPDQIIGSDVEFKKPEEVESALLELKEHWNACDKTLNDIIEYHIQFEHIHPFQFGNGTIGRLLMLKQCIEQDVDVIIINEAHKEAYMKGLYEAQMRGDDSLFKEMVPKCQEDTERRFSCLKETVETAEWDQTVEESMQM